MFKLSKKKILIIIPAALICLIIALFSFVVYQELTGPADSKGKEQMVIVPEGIPFSKVADDLETRGIITNKSLFMLWARFKDMAGEIKSGEYSLSPAMSPVKLLAILTKGAIITHPVTIPEGFSMYQIAELLEQRGLVSGKGFLALSLTGEMLEPYGIESPSLEGYLYPDTYNFGRGISARSAIKAMLERFLEMVEPLNKRLEESGMGLEKVVTLASIVEKETGQGKERPLIASVFLNRIKKRMRIESDPTVIYGIKDFNGNLTRKDLKTRTPYNTYVIKGLPPGPIANPGIDAIRAVLYPEDTKYLYFVSKNDGTHYFSKTLKEHNNAVLKYQKRRSGRKRAR